MIDTGSSMIYLPDDVTTGFYDSVSIHMPQIVDVCWRPFFLKKIPGARSAESEFGSGKVNIAGYVDFTNKMHFVV